MITRFTSMATALPNPSPAAASLAVSFARSVHTPPLLAKIYAEPDLLPASSSNGEPTMAVLPLILTEVPNSSRAAASLAVSFACCVQLFPSRTKIYAEPDLLPPSLSRCAPTMAVCLWMATDFPKLSPASASSGVSFACCSHTPFSLTKM